MEDSSASPAPSQRAPYRITQSSQPAWRETDIRKELTNCLTVCTRGRRGGRYRRDDLCGNIGRHRRATHRPKGTETNDECAKSEHSHVKADELCQQVEVCWLWFCTRCCQHRVDLTPMVGLVVEELNNAEGFRLLDPR